MSSTTLSANPGMPYHPLAMLDVNPLVYASRLPRLVARSIDGGTATTGNTSRSSNGSHSDHPVAPAIPAAVAVVVFVVCTIVIIKGARALRGHGVTPVYRQSAEPEKPQLWEVQMGETFIPRCAAAKWCQMMPRHITERLDPDLTSALQPVSVSYLPQDDLPRSALGRAPTLDAAAAAPAPRGRPLCAASRASRRSSSWSVFSEKSAAPARAEGGPAARLRVAVFIAMPSPGPSQQPPTAARDAPAPPPAAYLGLAEV
ncbi:hypothetical protein BD413DRAFT_657009 [Trametes elegans]|nr:hypothetical protein BD413DRAFT_657009 [Trametes elegans]